MGTVDQEQVVQALICAAQGLSAPEIMRLLSRKVSQPTLWRVLNQLRAEGRIVVEGSARGTRYHSMERGALPALRSLRLHEAIARRLIRDPSVLDIARDRLKRLRQVNPNGRPYHDRWAELIAGPRANLLRTLTEPSQEAAALRKESPFTVLVPKDERRRIFERFRAV